MAACLDRETVLGIRPESLAFVPEGTADAIPVIIEAETPLNEKVVTLALTKGRREVLISRPSGTAAPTAGEAFVAVNRKALLMFDKNTGLSMGDSEPFNNNSDAAA